MTAKKPDLARPHRDPEGSRQQARNAAEHGFAFLAQAVNHCDNPDVTYKYEPLAQRRFYKLMRELCALIETGGIVESPIGRARKDGEFQEFMRSALKRPARKPRVKRATV